MDPFEDLLFGDPDSQASIDDLWNDDFDNEQILESANNDYEIYDDKFAIPDEVTADSYWLPSDLLLASVDAATETYDDLLMEIDDSSLMNNAVVAAATRLPCDRQWIIARLEAMLENLVDGLLEGSEKLTLTIKSRANITRRGVIPSDTTQPTPGPRARQISFPGTTAQEAWNFTVLLRLIELIHGALVNNAIMTKRDIYYRHPDLFVKQAVVDRYVDDIACTLGVSRSQLNVTAAAKGLVAGPFIIRREDGTQLDGMDDKEGILVPKVEDSDHMDLTQVRWILVIEKEATFRSLVSSQQWAELSQIGVILTAKGYPDLATRLFLRHMNKHAPHVPMYAFVDFDPDGIAIMSTYKYGSFRLAHEDVALKDAPALSLSNLSWLGVKRHHISRLPIEHHDTHTGTMPELQGLMRLTARDRTKAARMLEWDLCSEAGPEPSWRHELQTMLVLNLKAEMQILDELPGGLTSFVCRELSQSGELGNTAKPEMTCSDDSLLF